MKGEGAEALSETLWGVVLSGQCSVLDGCEKDPLERPYS